MARRRLERVGPLERWQRHALLGLGWDGLGEDETMTWLIDGRPEQLLPVWQRHREALLPEWQELRGAAGHPMDGEVPRLPEVRR